MHTEDQPGAGDGKQGQAGGTSTDPNAGKGAQTPGGSAASGSQEGAAGSSPDESKWDESTRNYIKQLRAESANHRTKSKSLETQLSKLTGDVDTLKGSLRKALGQEDGDDSGSPEEQITQLKTGNEQMAFRLAVMESAFEHGFTSKDQVEYYEFLIQKKASELKDDEEVSDEAMAEIVTKVKGFSKPGSGTSTTSVNGQKPPPSDSSTQAVSVEAFAKMSIMEKSTLYAKDPTQYERLMAAAQDKKLI